MVEKRTLVIQSPAVEDSVTLDWNEDDEFHLEEPAEIIKWVINDITELKNDKELITALFDGFDRRNFDSVHRVAEIFNEKVLNLRENWLRPGQPAPEFTTRRGVYDHIKFIIKQSYHRGVEDATLLNRYQPGTPAVYGETSFDFVQQLMQAVHISGDDYFIDLGSGVGNVVMQVAATTNARKCVGVEKADIPAQYAAQMLNQFRFWMRFYGKPHAPIEISHGDFTADEFRETLHQSTVVFVNNYAFGPTLDQILKDIFQCLQEGTRIVSSGSFKPFNFRVNARNLNDVACILRIIECVKGKVSWTETPHPYYIYTIDRKQLEDYFDRTKNPKGRQDAEIRLNRKGAIANSLKDTTRIEGIVNGNVDTRYLSTLSRSGRRSRSAPGSKAVSRNSTATTTPTEGRTPVGGSSPIDSDSSLDFSNTSAETGGQVLPRTTRSGRKRRHANSLALAVRRVTVKRSRSDTNLNGQRQNRKSAQKRPMVASQGPANHKVRAKKARRTRTLAMDSLNMLHATTIESTNGYNFNSTPYNDPAMSQFVPCYQEDPITVADLMKEIERCRDTGEDVIATGIQRAAMERIKQEDDDTSQTSSRHTIEEDSSNFVSSLPRNLHPANEREKYLLESALAQQRYQLEAEFQRRIENQRTQDRQEMNLYLQTWMPGLGQFPSDVEKYFRDIRVRHLQFQRSLSSKQMYELLQAEINKEMDLMKTLNNRKSRSERAVAKLKEEGVKLINDNLRKLDINPEPRNFFNQARRMIKVYRELFDKCTTLVNEVHRLETFKSSLDRQKTLVDQQRQQQQKQQQQQQQQLQQHKLQQQQIQQHQQQQQKIHQQQQQQYQQQLHQQQKLQQQQQQQLHHQQQKLQHHQQQQQQFQHQQQKLQQHHQLQQQQKLQQQQHQQLQQHQQDQQKLQQQQQQAALLQQQVLLNAGSRSHGTVALLPLATALQGQSNSSQQYATISLSTMAEQQRRMQQPSRQPHQLQQHLPAQYPSQETKKQKAARGRHEKMPPVLTAQQQQPLLMQQQQQAQQQHQRSLDTVTSQKVERVIDSVIRQRLSSSKSLLLSSQSLAEEGGDRGK